MNLKEQATKEELRNLIASRDDKVGHHMLWVSVDGDVFLDLIPGDLTPSGFHESKKDQLQFRLETLQVDNDYVGAEAAKDNEWVDRVYEALVGNWERSTREYIDAF